MFKSDASQRGRLIKELIELDKLMVLSLQNFYHSSQVVDEDEFMTFTKSLADNIPGIQALEWIPRVENNKKGLFKIVEQQEGKMVPVEDRAVYYPIYFMQPKEGNEFYQGYDIASDVNISNLLEDVAETGEMAVSERMCVNDNGEKVYSYYLILPVYENNSDGVIEGFVAGVFRYKDLIDKSLSFYDGSDIDVELLDTTDSGKTIILHEYFSVGNVSETLPSDVKEYERASDIHYKETISIGDRTWTVFFYPGEKYVSEKRSNNDYMLLAFSIVLLMLISGFMVNAFYEQRNLEKLVRQKTKKLRDSEQRFNLALDGAELGLWDWNLKTNKIYFSHRWADMLGYKPSEIEDSLKSKIIFVHPDDVEMVSDEIHALINGDKSVLRTEHRMVKKSGEVIWVLDKGKVSEWDEDGTPLRATGTHLDVTEIMKLKKEYENLATKDQLTEIYNRRYYFDEAKKFVYRYQRLQEPFSIGIVDIDHFKDINDNFGHPVGDYILKEFAKYLNECIRNNDVIARYGGEEFIFLLENTNKDQAKAIIDRIKIDQADKTYEIAGHKIQFTFSGGVADVAESIVVDDLVSLADERLYKAKKAGRDRILKN